MARGWESKSVEDQIGDAEAAKEDQAKQPPLCAGARTGEPAAASAALANPNYGSPEGSHESALPHPTRGGASRFREETEGVGREGITLGSV